MWAVNYQFCEPPGVPEEKAIPKQVLKPVIAKMSSKLPAAISKVGMPLSTPYLPACKTSIDGTTTAGDTAPTTNLKAHNDQPLAFINKNIHLLKENISFLAFPCSLVLSSHPAIPLQTIKNRKEGVGMRDLRRMASQYFKAQPHQLPNNPRQPSKPLCSLN